MLVLGRKTGERVFVGDDVEVVVVEVRGNRVKLGFRAPDYLPIQRGELHEREHWIVALEEAECA
jgi:carbon storage regulator